MAVQTSLLVSAAALAAFLGVAVGADVGIKRTSAGGILVNVEEGADFGFQEKGGVYQSLGRVPRDLGHFTNNSEVTNSLLVEVRDIMGVQNELLEGIQAQLEANNPTGGPGAASGLAGVTWSGTDVTDCETTGCTLAIKGRGFIDGASEVYTVTAAITASAGHILVKEGVTCPPKLNMGASATVDECTEKCAVQSGCSFFMYGKGGPGGGCWTADDCREAGGFQAAEYDFFELSNVAGQSAVATVLAVTPNKIEVKFDSFESPPAAAFSTTLLVEEGGACSAAGCAKATIPYIAGDPGAFLSWTAVGPTINFPVAEGGIFYVKQSADPVTLDFNVEDADHDASNLVIGAVSSDGTVIKTEGISFSTVGDDGAVTMTAAFVSGDLKSGETTVEITVTDPVGMALKFSFAIELQTEPSCDGKDTGTNWALQSNGGSASMSPQDPHWGPNAGAINDGSTGWGAGAAGTHVKPGGWWKVDFGTTRIITKLRVYQCFPPYYWGNYYFELLTTDNEWVSVVDRSNSAFGRDDSFDITPTAATQLRFVNKGSHPRSWHRLEQIYAYGCTY